MQWVTILSISGIHSHTRILRIRSSMCRLWQKRHVAPEYQLQTHSTFSKLVMDVSMSVSKLGRTDLTVNNAGVKIMDILPWHNSDSKAAACNAEICDIFFTFQQCNVPANTHRACEKVNLLVWQLSFHQTFGHPTAQIWNDLTTKYGKKCWGTQAVLDWCLAWFWAKCQQ